MSPERRNKGKRKKKYQPGRSTWIEKIAPSPNVEADLLQEHLGIRFQQKPTKIEVLDLQKAGLTDIPYVGGLFEPKRNTFYIKQWDREKLFLSLHENTHGYVYQLNPELVKWGMDIRLDEQEKELMAEMLLREAQTAPDKLVSEVLAEWEKNRPSIGLTMVNEGIAQWCAAETISRMGKRESAHAYYQDYYYKGMDIDYAFFKAYYLGYLYVQGIMINLTSRGLGTVEALDLLITRPPRTWAQLEDTNESAKQLLSRKL